MNPSDSGEGVVDRNQMLHIAMISALVWLTLGSLIIWFTADTDFLGILQEGQPFALQLAGGITAGAIMGYAGVKLMQVPALREVAEQFGIVRIIKEARLTRKDGIYISVSAGISEEWLFRAAILPLAGLTISTVLFVLVHGYIKFSSRAHVFFALFMLLLSLVLGLLFLYQGIFAAMAAHAVYDMAAFYGIRQHLPEQEENGAAPLES
ncbi:CPBP family intramembrane glutamic endopeptidase [Cyclonatronum proteinivorum]|nr:CPBP family intramembrane glutamic endopeptidase [Cyclonatronum proteinivorum]